MTPEPHHRMRRPPRLSPRLSPDSNRHFSSMIDIGGHLSLSFKSDNSYLLREPSPNTELPVRQATTDVQAICSVRHISSRPLSFTAHSVPVSPAGSTHRGRPNGAGGLPPPSVPMGCGTGIPTGGALTSGLWLQERISDGVAVWRR